MTLLFTLIKAATVVRNLRINQARLIQADSIILNVCAMQFVREVKESVITSVKFV